jgi:hypothetical protein
LWFLYTYEYSSNLVIIQAKVSQSETLCFVSRIYPHTKLIPNEKINFYLLIANISLIGFGQNQKTHTVEAKETFYSIARLYDIPPKELMKVNPKFAPDYTS